MTAECKTHTPKYAIRGDYINRFIAMNCSVDLLAAKLFPNAKEITESMAAMIAVHRHVCPDRFERNDSDIAVVVVGDGHKPRTAALFAFTSRWNCISVDPKMKIISGFTALKGIVFQRLEIIGERIEDLNLDTTMYAHTIIVGVHSHATIDNMMSGIRFNTAHLVMIPCCVSQPPVGKNIIRYVDDKIWSPKNEIIISLDYTR